MLMLKMFKKKREKKSPLEKAPLRNAGQSLDEKIDHLSDEAMEYFFIPTFLLVFAGYEWCRWYYNLHINPAVITLLAIALLGYSFYRIIPIFRHIQNLRLGRDGERVLGQQLEALHAHGFKVLHDIPNEKGNIDHILIGPKGIYTVETKTISKPTSGATEIQYDGSAVSINGLPPDNKPIKQSEAEVHWVKNTLKERTGKDFSVQGVIIYLGWYVKGEEHCIDTWVLNEKRLSVFLDKATTSLNSSDAELAYASLSHYIRAVGKLG